MTRRSRPARYPTRVLHQVFSQHQQQVVAVVDHHEELAVVVLLKFEAVSDAREIRLIFFGEIVEWDDHLGAGGGHRIDGRWDFASGVNHARWLMCPCVIWEGDKPTRTPAGAPMTRIFWVPAESATILDTWHALGLRGTGSHDFALADVFVPEIRSVAATDPPRERGLLYDPRLHLSWLWTATVGNAMGIARGALDAFTELASKKSTTMSTALLRDPSLSADAGGGG
jgi:hypothetical protein